MSPQIEILEVVLLFIATAIFTFGIAGFKLNLLGKKYFRLSFTVILALSILSIQTAFFTYTAKFEIYYGWNAALLIFAAAIIVLSPILFRIAGTLIPLIQGQSGPQKRTKPQVQKIKETPGSFAELQPPLERSSEEAKHPAEITAAAPPGIETKPFGIAKDEIDTGEVPSAKSSEEKSAEKHIELENENIDTAEDHVGIKVSGTGADEKLPKTSIIKKSKTKKRTPVKRSPAGKTTSKTKRRGKK